MERGQRAIVSCIVCICIIAGAAAFSAGCNRSSNPPGNDNPTGPASPGGSSNPVTPSEPPTATGVSALLSAGKANEAFAMADAAVVSASVAEQRDIAATLIAYADKLGSTALEPGVAAVEAYLRAARLATDLPGSYVGLAAILRRNDKRADGRNPDREAQIAARAVALWRDNSEGSPSAGAGPDLSGQDELIDALCLLSATAGDFQLAVQLKPNNGEYRYRLATQLAAADELDKAADHALRARELLGDQPRVLALLADLGPLAPVAAETVVDVTPVRSIDGYAPLFVGAGRMYLCASVDDPILNLSLTNGSVSEIPRPKSLPIGVSADGKWIAWVDSLWWGETGEVVLSEVATGKTVILTGTIGNTYGLEFSPDGESVAFTCEEGLVRVNVDGSGRTVLAKASGHGDGFEGQSAPAWSHDGHLIAYHVQYYEESGPLTVIDATTGKAVGSWFDSAGRPYWSPVDSRLAATHLEWLDPQWVVSGSSAYILDFTRADAPKPKRLLDEAVSASVWGWSPDGRRLLMVIQRLGTGTDPDMSIRESVWLYDLETGKLSLLPFENAWIPAITWAGDGVIYCIDSRHHVVGVRVK